MINFTGEATALGQIAAKDFENLEAQGYVISLALLKSMALAAVAVGTREPMKAFLCLMGPVPPTFSQRGAELYWQVFQGLALRILSSLESSARLRVFSSPDSLRIGLENPGQWAPPLIIQMRPEKLAQAYDLFGRALRASGALK